MGKTRQSANLVSKGNIFSDVAHSRVGIQSSSPTSALDVNGEIKEKGSGVTTKSFFHSSFNQLNINTTDQSIFYMASGILGQVGISTASTNHTVYTVPASTLAVTNINIVNRSASAATVRLAISASDTPVNAEYIEYEASLSAQGVLERTGVVINSSKNVVAYASTTDVSVAVYGIEESA